jgi:hypothetical protein
VKYTKFVAIGHQRVSNHLPTNLGLWIAWQVCKSIKSFVHSTIKSNGFSVAVTMPGRYSETRWTLSHLRVHKKVSLFAIQTRCFCQDFKRAGISRTVNENGTEQFCVQKIAFCIMAGKHIRWKGQGHCAHLWTVVFAVWDWELDYKLFTS